VPLGVGLSVRRRLHGGPLRGRPLHRRAARVRHHASLRRGDVRSGVGLRRPPGPRRRELHRRRSLRRRQVALRGLPLAVRRFALRSGHLVATGDFDAAGAVDPTVAGATLEVSAPDGRLLYRATVAPAGFVANRTRRAFRYVAPRHATPPTGADGLARLVVQRARSRVHVTAAVTSTALAALGKEPTVRWMLRFGDVCARDLALDCAAESGSSVRCASASGAY